MNRQLSPTLTRVAAVLFCGGRGSRLEPLKLGSPKALAPVGGVPYLDGLLGKLSAGGIRDVVMAVSARTVEPITRFAGTGSRWGLRVRYSVDSGDVENGGALSVAMQGVAAPTLLCMNADTVHDVSIRRLLNFHAERQMAATVVTSDTEGQPNGRALLLAPDGRLVGFHEGSPSEVAARRALNPMLSMVSNSGVYVMERDELLRHSPGLLSGRLEDALLPTLCLSGRVAGYDNGRRFLLDYGTPARFQKAHEEGRTIRALLHTGNASC